MASKDLTARRKDILSELANLDRMRRGSIVQQYREGKNKEGEMVRRGPYPLYTFKEGGKTVSKRLKSLKEVAKYQQQIDNFRRFEKLTKELREIGEALCEALKNPSKKNGAGRH